VRASKRYAEERAEKHERRLRGRFGAIEDRLAAEEEAEEEEDEDEDEDEEEWKDAEGEVEEEEEEEELGDEEWRQEEHQEAAKEVAKEAREIADEEPLGFRFEPEEEEEEEKEEKEQAARPPAVQTKPTQISRGGKKGEQTSGEAPAATEGLKESGLSFGAQAFAAGRGEGTGAANKKGAEGPEEAPCIESAVKSAVALAGQAVKDQFGEGAGGSRLMDLLFSSGLAPSLATNLAPKPPVPPPAKPLRVDVALPPAAVGGSSSRLLTPPGLPLPTALDQKASPPPKVDPASMLMSGHGPTKKPKEKAETPAARASEPPKAGKGKSASKSKGKGRGKGRGRSTATVNP